VVAMAVAVGYGSGGSEDDVDSESGAGGVVVAVAVALIPVLLGFAIGVFAVSVAARIAATLCFVVLGFRMLPRNFRRLALCTSPRQLPELVPGLPDGIRIFTLGDLMREFASNRGSGDWLGPLFAYAILPLLAAIWFLPGWLYRITLKSTAWFWWPLSYLGDAPSRSWHAELYHRQALYSLRGRATIGLAILTVVGFIVINVVLSGAIFETNPLLTPLGFLFLLKQGVPPWQILSLLIATLSLWIVFWLNEANIVRQYGSEQNLPDIVEQAERKFYWAERLGRLRFVLFVIFQLILAGQALLFFNGRQCWFDISDTVAVRAEWLYGARMPGSDCWQHDHR
jgi:hypothetical protein